MFDIRSMHDFFYIFIMMRTGSNPADINRFISHIRYTFLGIFGLNCVIINDVKNTPIIWPNMSYLRHKKNTI